MPASLREPHLVQSPPVWGGWDWLPPLWGLSEETEAMPSAGSEGKVTRHHSCNCHVTSWGIPTGLEEDAPSPQASKMKETKAAFTRTGGGLQEAVPPPPITRDRALPTT